MNSFFERRYIISGIFIVIALVLLARLFYIQIVDDRYILYAKRNVIRTIIEYPARGAILDRSNNILVENQPVYDIMVTPNKVKPFDTLEFCSLMGIDKAGFDKRFEKAVKYSPYRQSLFESQLSAPLYASLQERLFDFPGFDVQLRSVRSYPDSIAAQFLGFIGEVNDKDIQQSHGYYRSGDYIGKSGVERQYDSLLRGQRGVQNWMVDSHNIPKGRFANGLFDTAAVAGERLNCSIDSRIQKLGEQLMHDKLGSIVAIEPSTGEILAFVSSPGYDPNLLVGRQRGNNAAHLNQDPYKPLTVRPIQAYYPPGSSFKPLSALIALQEGIITPQTTYYCPGYYISGNRRVKCLEPHGLVNLSSAVAGSCNGYFSMVFEKLMNTSGRKNIAPLYTNWRNNVMKFGLANKLSLDMPYERPGRLYSAAKYDGMYPHNSWRSSTILSLAIGQGECDATPLQLANIECTIANHGFYYQPHLIKSIGTKNIVRAADTVKHLVGIEGRYFEPVIDGMQAVVDRGTAINSRIPGIVMCGKTGTAQVHGKDNSVFVAFAPRDNPKIAIAVVVENAGQGAWWAAPIASIMVDKYLRDTIKVRPDGKEPEWFMEQNLLPPLPGVTPAIIPGKKDSAGKGHPDTSAKPARVNNSGGRQPNRRIAPAAVLKRREDE